MARCRMHLDVLAAATVLLPRASARSLVTSAGDPKAQLATLNVAVVPAVDSAGFFVALYGGLFRAQGLSVHFIPSVSSETEINRQAEQLPMANPVNISCDAYPSYIEAQENGDAGERPSRGHPGVLAADLKTLPPPLGVSPQVAAVMALDQYPLSPVDVVRLQRAADVMRQFLGGQRFDVAEMITAPSQ